MQLERVGGISVRHVRFEVGRQVQNLNGLEWAPTGSATWLKRLSRAGETYFFTQIPHPIHNSSDKKAFRSVGLTSIQSLPILTTGHDRLHS